MPQLPPVDELATSMIDAAKASFAKDWPKVRDYTRTELEKLARILREDILAAYIAGKLQESEARNLLQVHERTTKQVLLAVDGMTQLAVENAILAALRSVGKVVNGAVGFSLLPLGE